MNTIVKRSGNEERFRTDKVINSMLGAGISRETAHLVAAEIKHHEAITTMEVRRQVIGAIKNREPQAAQRYESHPKRSHKK